MSAPHTAGRPRPRATTAAWLVSPPREVSTPATTDMAGSSAGDVSGRTRMTGVPSSTASSARQASNTAIPLATPGEAASPSRPAPDPARTRRSALRMQHRLDVGRADQAEGGVDVERVVGIGGLGHDLADQRCAPQPARSRRLAQLDRVDQWAAGAGPSGIHQVPVVVLDEEGPAGTEGERVLVERLEHEAPVEQGGDAPRRPDGSTPTTRRCSVAPRRIGVGARVVVAQAVAVAEVGVASTVEVVVAEHAVDRMELGHVDDVRPAAASASTTAAQRSRSGSQQQGAEARVHDVEACRPPSGLDRVVDVRRTRSRRRCRRSRGQPGEPRRSPAGEKSSPVTRAPSRAHDSVSRPKWHWRCTRSRPSTGPSSSISKRRRPLRPALNPSTS